MALLAVFVMRCVCPLPISTLPSCGLQAPDVAQHPDARKNNDQEQGT